MENILRTVICLCRISWKGKIEIVETYKRQDEKNPVFWKACNILTNEVSTFKVDCDKLKPVIGWWWWLEGYQQWQGNGVSNQGGLIIPTSITSRSVRKADLQWTNCWSGPVNLLAQRSQEAVEHLLCRLWEGKHSTSDLDLLLLLSGIYTAVVLSSFGSSWFRGAQCCANSSCLLLHFNLLLR